MKKFFVVLFLIISLSLFADIPSTGYDSQSWTNPGSALTDFTGMIDLSLMSSDWWLEADNTGATRGRATKSDGTTELSTDWIDYDDTAETGWLRVIWSGTLASSGTQIIRIYPPDTGNTAYAPSDTYGSDNAYNSSWESYWQNGGTLDRLSTTTGTGYGGIISGGGTGQTGDGTVYDGSDDYIDTNIIYPSGDVTYILWADADISSSNVSVAVGGSTQRISFRTEQYNNTGNVGMTFGDVADYDSGISTPSGLSFYSVIADYGNTAAYNINGATGSQGISTPSIAVGDVFLGANQAGTDKFTGTLCEVQIHSITRNTDWISQEYAQTNNNSSFWGTWAWTSGGGIVHPVISGNNIHSLIFGGQILTGMLIMWNIMITISVCYLFHRINKKIIYDPDLTQAQIELDKYLNGGP